MNLYIMRHGKTVWNEKGITQGQSNNRLSKAGKEITLQVAKKYEDVNFDIVYCSPLMRTIQTANIMNKTHKAKIIKDSRLIEIDQGIFTGRSKDSLSEEEIELKFSRAESCLMESYESLYKRVEEFLNFLKNKNYENVLVITHNCNASFLENIIMKEKVDFTNDNYLRKFKNGEVKYFLI